MITLQEVLFLLSLSKTVSLHWNLLQIIHPYGIEVHSWEEPTGLLMQ